MKNYLNIFLINKQINYFKDAPYLKELAEKLESFKGDLLKVNKELGITSVFVVSFETKEDCMNLLNRGEFFGKTDKFVKGRPINCHQNSALLADKYPEKYQLVTGYALSDDSLWRCHSWLLEKNKKGKEIVVETTEPRIAYYGYKLTKEELQKFLFDNY